MERRVSFHRSCSIVLNSSSTLQYSAEGDGFDPATLFFEDFDTQDAIGGLGGGSGLTQMAASSAQVQVQAPFAGTGLTPPGPSYTTGTSFRRRSERNMLLASQDGQFLEHSNFVLQPDIQNLLKRVNVSFTPGVGTMGGVCPQFVYKREEKYLFVDMNRDVTVKLGDMMPGNLRSTLKLVAYLEFEKAPSIPVIACRRHSEPPPPNARHKHRPTCACLSRDMSTHVLRSCDSTCVPMEGLCGDNGIRYLEWAYPVDVAFPSVSVRFGCRSSCQERRVMILHFGIVIDGFLQDIAEFRVKVCSAPGRDSGTVTTPPGQSVLSTFKRTINDIQTTLAPKRTKFNSISDRGVIAPKNEVKRVKNPSANVSQDGSNKVYPLYVYGYDAYVKALDRINDLTNSERHCKRQETGYSCTQITRETSVSSWLELLKKPGLQWIFDSKGFVTMGHLLDNYHPNLFEDMGIKEADNLQVLQSRFVNWRNGYLHSVVHGCGV